MKKLYKSNDRIITGVLGGIAEYFEMDPTLIRIIYAFLSVSLIGSPIILYIVMSIIMPDRYE